MAINKDPFQTHKNRLQKIYTSLILRQVMNKRKTKLELTAMDEAKLQNALHNINTAIKYLNFGK